MRVVACGRGHCAGGLFGRAEGAARGARRSSGVTLWMEGEPRQGRVCREVCGEVEGIDGNVFQSATKGGCVVVVWLPAEAKALRTAERRPVVI
jgi:hypothetical protein